MRNAKKGRAENKRKMRGGNDRNVRNTEVSIDETRQNGDIHTRYEFNTGIQWFIHKRTYTITGCVDLNHQQINRFFSLRDAFS